VVFAGVPQPLVAAGESGVDLAGVVGGEEQRLAEYVVADLGAAGALGAC
jgi:hypothetical protein